MARKLTKKQRGFVQDYVRTGNGTQSVLKHYNTEDYSTAGNIASDNLNKPKIIDAIQSIADRLPNELLEKVHLEGLQANRVVYNEHDSGYNIEIPDYAIRHKYLDSAYKLKGLYAQEKGSTVQFNLMQIINGYGSTPQ